MIKNQNKNKLLNKIIIITFWLAIWQLITIIIKNPLLLPSPVQALNALLMFLATKGYYFDVLNTMGRCILGISFSFITGFAFALLSYRSKYVRMVLSLPVSLLKSIPVMAIIIYALIILSSNQVAVFVCFLMCFPIVYVNILSGFDNVNYEYIEMAKVFSINKSMVFKHILFPSVMPQIKASLNLLSGLSWKAVVSAEVLSIPDFGMGYNLMNAKYYLETENLFAWIISIVFFSYMFEQTIKKIINKSEKKEYIPSKINIKSTISGAYSPSGQDIVIRNLNKAFDNNQIFKNFNITFKGNSRTSIIAPSGYGKTTLLRIIAGLEPFDSGNVESNKSLNISYLFQEDRLIPWLNIYDNLALVLAGKLPTKEIDKRIDKILHIMELWDDRFKLPCQLSGGMRHRVSISRAFIFPADILILDEPFKGLDALLIDRIINGAWLRTTKNKTVIFSTHTKEISQKLADQVIDLTLIV
ncbi:MAG: ATP-binding cassette domain-containing protein [Anaerovoracaceae bacterium]